MKISSISEAETDDGQSRSLRRFFSVFFILITIGMFSQGWLIAETSVTTITAANSTIIRRNHFTSYLERLQQAQQTWIETTLYHDYGKEAFENIFLDNDSLLNKTKKYLRLDSFQPVSEDNISTDRLRRKLQIKLLQHQLEGNATLVWVTGGHSAAAAHGNLYNQSYTAVLERDLQHILPAIGMPLEARNYAMGGSGSGPELSLCVEQIYGTDVDLLSWDFGMTDVYSPVRILLYATRANLLPHHPPIFALRADSEGRSDLLKEAQDMGMSAFYLPESTQKRQRDGIPETTFFNAKELPNTPPMTRAFKCSAGIETGDPTCGDEKYSSGLCDDRAGKANWHPGFKSHALDGHTIALFLVQELLHAAEELAIRLEGYQPTLASLRHLRKLQDEPEEPMSPPELLSKLQAEEQHDFEKFQQAALPELASQVHQWHKCQKDLSEDEKGLAMECSQDASFDQFTSVFFKGPGICHTARLPSQTRYRGYLVDDTTKIGGPVPTGKETYETGVPVEEAAVDSILKLVYKKDQREVDCPVTVSPDYKDYFYAHQQDGWAKLVLPNKAEKEAYSYETERFYGLIGIAFLTCPWNRCPDGFVGTKRDFDDGKFEITINGSPVESLMLFHDVGCYFLKGPEGYQWIPNSDSKDYEIAIRAVEDGSHVEISSFILY